MNEKTRFRDVTQEEYKTGIETLGRCGAMICGSKSQYRDCNPDNFVIFNSNVCTDEAKIWHGDIDVTLSKDKLIKLSKELNKKLYILYEMDGRFENAAIPVLERAAVTIDGDIIVYKV